MILNPLKAYEHTRELASAYPFECNLLSLREAHQRSQSRHAHALVPRHRAKLNTEPWTLNPNLNPIP